MSFKEKDTGCFFNWPHPEFAKCWPVSNWFQKNVKVPDWPPLWSENDGEVNVIPTLRKFRGGPVEAFLGGASLEGGGAVKKNTLYEKGFNCQINRKMLRSFAPSTAAKLEKMSITSALFW